MQEEFEDGEKLLRMIHICCVAKSLSKHNEHFEREVAFRELEAAPRWRVRLCSRKTASGHEFLRRRQKKTNAFSPD